MNKHNMEHCKALGRNLKIALPILFTAHLSSRGISIRICKRRFSKKYFFHFCHKYLSFSAFPPSFCMHHFKEHLQNIQEISYSKFIVTHLIVKKSFKFKQQQQ